MALITCPECGQSISSLADKCPHCGLPQSHFNVQPTGIQPNIQQQGIAQPYQQQQIQQQMPQQMPQQQIYVADNRLGGERAKIAKPNNYLALSIIALFGGIFGIISLIYSSKVDTLYANGSYTEAISASNRAKTWAIVSIILGVLFTTGWFILLFAL